MIIYLHLLEPSSIDKLVDLALARPEYELDFTFQNRQVVFPEASTSCHIVDHPPVQKHEAVLCPNEQVHAPERGTEDLRVEPLLVLPDLRRVRAVVVLRSHIHVDVTLPSWHHRANLRLLRSSLSYRPLRSPTGSVAPPCLSTPKPKLRKLFCFS